MHDGVIHSNARMTYTDVNAILTDRDPEVHRAIRAAGAAVRAMHELFEILNARRHRRGSIDFDLKEPEIMLDDQGLVEEIIALERNVAHRIIEEFMLRRQRDRGAAPRRPRHARRSTASTRSPIR